jgi:hypothetical protein
MSGWVLEVGVGCEIATRKSSVDNFVARAGTFFEAVALVDPRQGNDQQQQKQQQQQHQPRAPLRPLISYVIN